MADTIDTSGITVTNDFDVKGRAILALVAQYIPGFVGLYYGFKTLGTAEIAYPALFVEPVSQKPVMYSTGKYHLKIQYNLYFFVVENNPDALVSLITSGAEALKKLFSNNALGTLDNQFKAYSNFWISSEMLDLSISPYFINAIDQSEARHMRAGKLVLEVEDAKLM